VSLRARIFLVFAGVVAASFVALVYWIRDDLRPRYLESLEEPLVDSAHILAELLADDVRSTSGRQQLHAAFERAYARRFLARIYALERDRVDMRVYVTDERGIVIFDSDRGRDEGRDYSRWNDVMRALKGEYGARSTRDDPLDPVNAVVYVAAPILVEGRTLGVVSVGKPKRNVDQFVRAARQKILIGGFAAAGFAILLGLVLTLWVTRPLEKLREYAQAVRAGQRVSLPELGHSEIGLTGRAMEEMRVALEGKNTIERYVQVLTHELKSPLAAIRGAAELLEEEVPPAERRRFLSNIRGEVRRMQDLVERLLAQASVEKRQSLDQVETIDLAALTRSVIDSLQPSLRSQNVTAEFRADADCSVQGEPFLLRQAISNLLQNALDFSPAHAGIEISVRKGHDAVELQLRDHGPGIPDYALARVFERFYSLPKPSGRGKGTGLGLSFVREVAELHRGSVVIHNHPAGGAEVRLRLPAS
jgi:two-component system, OmpR family, sensor histidine kinase CreC